MHANYWLRANLGFGGGGIGDHRYHVRDISGVPVSTSDRARKGSSHICILGEYPLTLLPFLALLFPQGAPFFFEPRIPGALFRLCSC